MNIKPYAFALESITANPPSNSACAKYKIGFGDLDAKTSCTETLTLFIDRDKSACSIEIAGCIAESPQEAIAKLSRWLEAYSKVLHDQKPVIQIPIF